jgi:hypothetical protein
MHASMHAYARMRRALTMHQQRTGRANACVRACVGARVPGHVRSLYGHCGASTAANQASSAQGELVHGMHWAQSLHGHCGAASARPRIATVRSFPCCVTVRSVMWSGSAAERGDPSCNEPDPL